MNFDPTLLETYRTLLQTTDLQKAYQEFIRLFRFLRNELERQLPEGQSLHREIYKGTLPAASGPGIEYTVVLFTPADSVDNGLFRLTMNYIDAENGEDQLFLQQGELKGQRDRNAPEATTVLRLQPYGDDESVYFEKQQDGLLMLDRKGQVIQSDLNYKLKRW